jgi:hypothetical protein
MALRKVAPEMIKGGTFTGDFVVSGNLVTNSDVGNEERRVRSIIISQNPAQNTVMRNGDIWIQYK